MHPLMKIIIWLSTVILGYCSLLVDFSSHHLLPTAAHVVTSLLLPPVCLVAMTSFIILIFGKRQSSLLRRLKEYSTKSKAGVRVLPPGSMGWPYIGETLKLYTENPNSFFSTRQKRYGDIFKTHILGCPCVMIASPEAARLVLVTKAELFKPTYPPSKEKMIGPEAIFFHQGEYHWKLKRLLRNSFAPSVLSGSVSHIETIVLNFLPTWEHMGTVNTLCEMKKFAFEVAMLSAFGEGMEVVMLEGIKDMYHRLEKGYNSMPLNLPGTRFYNSVKARKQLNDTLKKLIAKRRSSKQVEGGLLGVLLASSNNKETSGLSDSQIADNIIGVIFAAHDTTASILTWTLKYLHDNPHILHSLTMEQERIRQKMIKTGRSGLTWEDTKTMPLTNRVIQETLRAASILSFTFREAVEDVEFQGGYVIPKGWKVLPLFRSIHHSPKLFPHPEKFDPSRFEVAPKANTYMPFGRGVHSCPGSELAKLEILIFLHHFTTSYRWTVVGDDQDGIQYGPFPVPKHGLPIQIHPRKNNT